MGPGAAVVGYAVATGVGGIVGHLLTAVEFALLGIDGVDVCGGGAFVRVYSYYLMAKLINFYENMVKERI